MNLTLAPRIIRWARERAGLDASTLAKKLGVKPERVTEWEETVLLIRRRQAWIREFLVEEGGPSLSFIGRLVLDV